MAEKAAKKIDVSNKKASFEFFFLERYTAGMVLTGTEIKSIRLSKFNMTDAYCFFINGELYVKNLNISKYEQGTHYNHEPLRDRKLLLQRKELKKLANKLTDKGLTVIPTRLFINDKGLAKLDIALAKGKKLYDKRDSIKERDVARERMRES
ncbi:SsrA-binding protein [Emticicia oligotrophica DSM 17448]|uniref:SsrA-binding protein n=1 Tax=Emticicia oligotrophica (strain DSM 17448 / CIP 109782 / MTCC 6937 / GPTSA100-15) TaxID=929562 RepID=A0ABN4ANB9_EMTOG|nr:SsrA-binding protein SmpB [Emticicia oligotrophica]AFK03629.1 SsrA-binding protein [Emticicia oligotrophica DSM 17448]